MQSDSGRVRDTSEDDALPPAGIEAQQLRNAVQQRLFGIDADPVRIGRYTVLKRLGSGGMGVVYAAYDTELDRKVAVKLLHGDDRGGATWRNRLRREAQALAQLSHPNVVHVYDVGEHGDQVFVPMEFVDGPNLKAWVEARPRRPREILAIYLQAGRGLAAAHQAGIVHRDFKPDNAIVGRAPDGVGEDRVRVLDFGLARGTSESTERLPAEDPSLSGSHALLTPLTHAGAIMGTPAYMAPEQHLGLPADERTDQFSFCVALYEALYGHRPFAGRRLGELREHVLEGRIRAVPREARVPAWIRRVLVRGLARRPEDRFSSMVELLDALERDPAVWVRRGILAAATVVALVAGTVAWNAREQRHATEQARLSARARAEEERAETAEAQLVSRADKLTLAEIDEFLERDPTRAAAHLLNLSPASEAWNGSARLIASDARHRGIARHVAVVPGGRVPHALSPDGRMLVTRLPEQGSLHLVDLDRGADVELVRGAEGVPVVSIAPAGDAMVTLHAPRGVALWTLEDPEPRLLGDVPEGHYGVAWSPDRGFVTFGRDPVALSWSRAGERVALGVHAEEVEAAVATGDAIATADTSGAIRWFDRQGQLMGTARGLAPLAFRGDDPGGPLLATATNLAEIQVLAVADEDRGLQIVAHWPGGDAPVRAIAFRPGSPELAIGDAEGDVRLWNYARDEQVRVGRHEQDVIALRFDPGGEALVSQSLDRTLAVVELSSGRRQVLRGHDGVGFWAIDARGQQVVTVGWEGEIRHWPLPFGQSRPWDVPGAAVTALLTDPEIVVGTADGTIVRVAGESEAPRVLQRLRGVITSLLVLPTGELVAATDRGRVVVLPRDGDGLLRQLRPESGASVRVAASPSGAFVWAGGVDGSLLRWRGARAEAETVELGDVGVQHLVARDDGSAFIAGWTGDGHTWRVEVAPDRSSTRRRLGTDGILGVAIDPASGRTAWSTHTREIRIFDGEQVRNLGQHPALVDAMMFDASGRTLVTIGRDGKVMIWDLVSRRRRVAEVSPRALRAAAFDAKRQRIITGGDEQRLYFVLDDLPLDADGLQNWIRQSTSMRVSIGRDGPTLGAAGRSD